MAWADIPNQAYVVIGVAVGGAICILATYLNQRAYVLPDVARRP